MSEIPQKIEGQSNQDMFDVEEALLKKIDKINNISHELRSPIQGITTISRELVDQWDELDLTKRKKFAIEIAKSSQRIFSMVTNLLDYASLQNNGIILNLENLDIKECIEKMIEECRMLYLSGKKQDLMLSIDAPQNIDYKTAFDYEKITQVLRNIYTNAVKFTESGVISTKIKLENNRYIISITDHGVGIPEDELETIFEPFYQSSRTKNGANGTGLGLAISKEIVEAHGGQIFASNVRNKGAKFTFWIPESRIAENKLNEDSYLDHPIFKKPLKVLAVDDEEISHMSIDLMLDNTNFKVTHLENGKDAIKYLENNQVDLLLLDLMMPDITGKEVLDRISQNQISSNHLKVIVQSGKILRFNPDDTNFKSIRFINKPYIKEMLYKTIVESFSE
jgi:two-component system, sensor histidine kinase ChiS